MPRRNRVDPAGRLIATPHRGSLMGNRGRLHDDRGRIVRHHDGRRWISCLLEYRGNRRPVMAPGHYTELFFLDEPTALAAGHRPCGQCRRPALAAYCAALADADYHIRPAELDDVLHEQRSQPLSLRPHVPPHEYPAGCFFLFDDHYYVKISDDRYAPWTPAGYPCTIHLIDSAVLVTPALSVDALRHGYTPLATASRDRG